MKIGQVNPSIQNVTSLKSDVQPNVVHEKPGVSQDFVPVQTHVSEKADIVDQAKNKMEIDEEVLKKINRTS